MLLSGPVCIVICVMVVKLFGAHSGLEANVANVFCYSWNRVVDVAAVWSIYMPWRDVKQFCWR